MRRAAFTTLCFALLVSLVPGAGAAAPPTFTAAPEISGEASEGSLLSVSTGTWTGSGTITYTYQWLRCGYAGSPCALVADATSPTYTPTAADAGATIRAVVTAKDSAGTNSASTAPTDAVTGLPPDGGLEQPDGKISIPPTSVTEPHRVLIDLVEAPATVAAGGTFTLRAHVSDTRGYVVRELDARAAPVAKSLKVPAASATTAATGWATFKIAAPKLKPGLTYRVSVKVSYLPPGSDDDAEPLLFAERIVLVKLKRG
jgi:hypothetical protein